MLVVGFPKFRVNNKGVFKSQEVKTWDNSSAKCYVDEIIIPKEVFDCKIKDI